jgi:hypothetical protein
MGAVLVGIRMFLHPARKRLTERRKEEFPFGIKRRCGGDKADRRINLPGVFSHRGCDRAIPNPNLLIKSFAYKIKHLLKNVVWLYSTGAHANALDVDL